LNDDKFANKTAPANGTYDAKLLTGFCGNILAYLLRLNNDRQ